MASLTMASSVMTLEGGTAFDFRRSAMIFYFIEWNRVEANKNKQNDVHYWSLAKGFHISCIPDSESAKAKISFSFLIWIISNFHRMFHSYFSLLRLYFSSSCSFYPSLSALLSPEWVFAKNEVISPIVNIHSCENVLLQIWYFASCYALFFSSTFLLVL